jgi:hypothetical protein
MHRLRLDLALDRARASPAALALAHSLRYSPPVKKKKGAGQSEELIEVSDEQSQSRDIVDTTDTLVENVVLALKHCLDMVKVNTYINITLATLLHTAQSHNARRALEVVRGLFNAEQLKTTNKARKKLLLTSAFCRIYTHTEMEPLNRPLKTLAVDRKAMRLLVTLATEVRDSSLLTIICTRTEHEKLFEDVRVIALTGALDVSHTMTRVNCRSSLQVLAHEVEDERRHPIEIVELDLREDTPRPVTRQEKVSARCCASH